MKTIKFFFKSLWQNTCILLEKQKWWYALIILLMSLVIAISPMLSSGYMSNVNGLFNSNIDTAIDKGLVDFANDLNADNDIIIEAGEVTGTGDFAAKNIIDDGSVVKPNAIYTHKAKVYNEETKQDEIKEFTTLRVFVINIDSSNSVGQKQLEEFLKTSVYQVDSLKPEVPGVIQSNFLIFCNNTVHGSFYKANAKDVNEKAVGSITGKFTEKVFNGTYKLSDMKYNNRNIEKGPANEKTIKANFIQFFNDGYTPVRITNTWVQTGIYTSINFCVAFFAGLTFWAFSRSRSSIKKYTFIESQKIAWIMCLSPAIASAVISVLIPSFGVFSFLLIISFRVMNAVSKINGKYNQDQNNEPVYKARQ